MATRAKGEAKPSDVRGKIVDALMELASEQRFEEISIRDICKAADLSLADFRDAFPSKGAVVAGLSRRIDHAVLAQSAEELADESPRERLFDILMRRLEAMAPYREGLREVAAWLRRNPAAALAMNPVVINSMRFMLEAAGIEVEGAPLGRSSCKGWRWPGRASSASGSTTRIRACRRRWPSSTANSVVAREQSLGWIASTGSPRRSGRSPRPPSRRAGAAAIAGGVRVATAKQRRRRTLAITARRWCSRQASLAGSSVAESAAVRADVSNLNHSLQRLLAMRCETRAEPRR